MGNLLSRSLGQAPPEDGQILSHRRASTMAVSGQVDRLSFQYQGTTPKILTATSGGLDHSVSYDTAGNGTQYFVGRTYSPRNLLSSVIDNSSEGPTHRIDYGYDGRGVRVSRAESPTPSGTARRYYTYSPELHLLQITVDDSPNVWGQRARTMTDSLASNHGFVWFNGKPVFEGGPARTPDPGVLSSRSHTPAPMNVTDYYFIFTDHLGTPLLETNTSGQVAWRAEYEPYGNVYLMRAGARTDQPLRLPGQDLAMTWEGTEENHNIFRWYRVGWGRYTQADPIELEGGINLYAYGAGDPISAEDPFGLSAKKKNCIKYANEIQGALKHAKHHNETNQSPRDICGMLNKWLPKFNENNCQVYFPSHGKQAQDYIDKNCKGGCKQPADEPSWWKQLDQWLKDLKKSLPDLPPMPGPEPFPMPEPIPIPIG
jgi:RHS repeat-associated protein